MVRDPAQLRPLKETELNKTKATQRSLALLRRCGWTVCIVEKFLPCSRFDEVSRRIDAFGFGDLLACRCIDEYDERSDSLWKRPKIALVQTFPLARWKDHEAKIRAIPEFQSWKDAGGLVIMHGWALKPKDGVRGAKKTWQVREQIL